MNGTCTALAYPASVFGAHQLQSITQHPKHGSVRVNVHLHALSVDSQVKICHDSIVFFFEKYLHWKNQKY
jgi:hypothetical protein